MKHIYIIISFFLLINPNLWGQQSNTGYNLSEIGKTLTTELRIDDVLLTRSAIITTKFGEVNSPETISSVLDGEGEVIQSFSGLNDFKLITKENSDVYAVAKLVPGSLKEQPSGMYIGEWNVSVYRGAEQLPTHSIITNSSDLEISSNGTYLYTKTYPLELYDISNNGTKIEIDVAYRSYVPAVIADKLLLFSTSRTSTTDENAVFELRENHAEEMSEIVEEINSARGELIKYMRNTPEYRRARVLVDSLEQIRYKKTIDFRQQIRVITSQGVDNTKLEVFDLRDASLIESMSLNSMNSGNDYWFDFNQYRNLDLVDYNSRENSISVKFNYGSKSDNGRRKEGERLLVFGENGQIKAETDTFERILDFNYSNSDELLILSRENTQDELVLFDVNNPESLEAIQIGLGNIININRALINDGSYIISSGGERKISANDSNILTQSGNQRKVIPQISEGEIFIGTNSLGAVFLDTSTGRINIYN